MPASSRLTDGGAPDFDAAEGQEHYRVMLWPSAPAEPTVLKRGFWCCRAGRHAT